jgi:integrase
MSENPLFDIEISNKNSRNGKEKPPPSYRRHRQSGQAVTTLTDGFGNRRDVLLGRFGTAASRVEYARVIAEWETAGRRLPPKADKAADLTIHELVAAYWRHAVEYYRFKERGKTGTEECLRGALRVVKESYGHTIAKDFGPLALKACRQMMLGLDWSRPYINAQVDRIRRMFKWGVSEEMIPESVYSALMTIEGLRKGKTNARDGKKVRPVPPEHVEAAKPFLPPVIRAMLDLQLLTGCRPNEACIIRPVDLDMKKPACWSYRPQKHKTENQDIERIIFVGPRAQEVLRPWLGTKVDGYCFSPAASEAEWNAIKKATRRTPMTRSQAKRRPKSNRKRAHRDHYDVTSYRNAIYRACDKAFPAPEPVCRRTDETSTAWKARLTAEQKAELRRWQKEHRWHPNQLRHTRATELRATHGLDVTKTILGHTKVETTQIYAEKDMAAAMELVSRIG